MAGLDALHVGEDHGRDIQVRIEGRVVRIGCRHVARGRDGDVARVRVSESWLSVVALSRGFSWRGFLTNYRKSATMREKVRYAVTSGAGFELS